jgi:hypothetical protein
VEPDVTIAMPDVTTVLRHGVTTVVRGPHPGWRDAA